MSVSLFRRWRSQRFSDLVGQESVVSTLQNVLGAGSPARAYLFCGPRGTGKTSSARIFAKALNCENGPSAEPCNECSQCVSISDGSNLDVFEIDAASHTQVDKIRDFIVEKVHFTPVAARYKVYIIDEVHKLSTSSFNALLKTLEEPPSHVVFILATTHPHEMPPTILSRCQRYDFRPLTATETEKHLAHIASTENIQLDEDAARQLARAADGSLRDALVLFEQATVFSEGRVTRDKVLDLLGGVGYEVLEEMFCDLHGGNAAGALRRLDDWIRRGRDLKRLAESFQNHLRILLLLKVKAEDQSIAHLSAEERASLERICQLLSVPAITGWLKQVMEMLAQIREGRQARLEWEMFLVGLALPETDAGIDGLSRRLEKLEAGGGSSSGTGTPDRRVMERLSELERQLAQLEHAKEARVQIIEAPKAAPSESTSVSRPEPEAPKAAPAASPEPVTPQAAPPPARPQPVAPKTSPSEMVIPTPIYPEPVFDSIEEWLEMPTPLVTGLVGGPAVNKAAPLLAEGVSSTEPIASDPQGDSKEDLPEPAPEPMAEDVTPEPEPIAPTPVAEEVTPESELVAPTAEEATPEPEPIAPTAEEGTPEPEPAVKEAPRAPQPDPVGEEPAPEPERQPVASQPKEAPSRSPDSRGAVTLKEAPAVPKTQVSAQPPGPPVTTATATSGSPLPEHKEFWRRMMQLVKEQDIRLHAVLADAKLTTLADGHFHLAIPPGYEWHFGKVKDGRAILESVASKLAERSMRMECSLGGEKAAPPKDSEHDDLVQRAAGVFGGASIVE